MIQGVNNKAVIKGALTFVPLVNKLTCRGSTGTDSALYCYAVWLRICHYLEKSGYDVRRFRNVCELGPGDSLGIGACALLTSAESYIGLDAKKHASRQANVAVLGELLELFRRQHEVPGIETFPQFIPDDHPLHFPRWIANHASSHGLLQDNRVASIREGLLRNQSPVEYVAPWNDERAIKPATMDLVFSHVVMEHIDDYAVVYKHIETWLRPGAVALHIVDYGSHFLSEPWHGHLTCSDSIWRIVRGTRPYFINRRTHSHHLDAITESGLKITHVYPRLAPRVPREKLSRSLRDIPDEDLSISGAMIIATKP